jgi:hypothetical protein
LKKDRKTTVKYSLTRTVNTGNYENIKIEYGMEVECLYAEADDAFKEVVKEVKDRLIGEVKTLRSKIKAC